MTTQRKLVSDEVGGVDEVGRADDKNGELNININANTNVNVNDNEKEIMKCVVEVRQQVSVGVFVFFSYVYFIQGAISGLIRTTPYVYQKMPDVDTMIIFNSISLPYSFKFLIAPFLEKFSFISYGKRKTWIILSQVITSILLFSASFYTHISDAKIFAVFCFFIQICIVIQNIALHALIVKEITSPHQSGLIQSYAQIVGALVGSMLMLKLTSKEFASSMGFDSQLTSVRTLVIWVSVVILVPVVVMHFKLKQRVLQSQIRGSQFSIIEILRYCNVFIQPKTRYFRFCIYMFVYHQGLNFFYSLYDYQLIKAGFSRDSSNTIGNIIIIPISFLTFFYKDWTLKLKGHRNSIILSTSIMIIICLYLCIIFPLDFTSQFILLFILSIFDYWRAYNFTVMMNEFPIHALTAIYLTVLNSFYNFGNLQFIHGQMCKWFGWRLMSVIGIVLQMLIVLYTGVFDDWVKKGDVCLSKQIEQIEQNVNKQQYKQMQ